jgi:phosphoadenosine phosphosulfate reductase
MTQPIQPLLNPSRLDLGKLNQKFENVHPKDILTWCIVNIPNGLVQVSAFNVDDLLITDLLYRALKPSPPVPVLFLNTLHHFPQTLGLVAHAKDIYNLDLKLCQVPKLKSQAEFASRYGDTLWQKDPQEFHDITKRKPLQKGLKELKTIGWITGRYRNQADTPADLPIFELDGQQRLKINPLANWTRRETWAYVFEYDVIYNPLHDQGYPIIGDQPTTTPVSEGEQVINGEILACFHDI